MSTPLSFVFDHVHIFCSNLDATERWFSEGMDAQLMRRRVAANGAKAVDLRLGGVGVFLRGLAPGEAPPAPTSSSGLGTNHFALVVSDIDSIVGELRRRGVEFESPPRKIGQGSQIAFVRGPDGVRIELIQRP